MRHASLATQSNWILLAFFCCAALASGFASQAQEVTKASYSRTIKASPEKSLNDIPSAIVESKLDVFAVQGYAVERFEVSKVLEVIRTQENVSQAETTSLLLSSLASAQTNPSSIQVIARSESNGEKIYLGGLHPSMKIIGNQLYTFGSSLERRSTVEKLKQIARVGLPRLRIHLQVLEVPLKTINEVTLNWEKLSCEVFYPYSRSGFWPFSGPLVEELRFEEEFKQRILESSRVVSSQELTLASGGRGHLLLDHDAAVTDFNPVSREATEEVIRKEQNLAKPGFHLILSGKLEPPNDVALSISLVDIDEVDTFPFDGETDGNAPPSKSREIIQCHYERELSLGKTLALTEMDSSQKVITKVVKTPVLGRLPLIGKHFDRDEASSESVVRMFLIRCEKVER